MTTDPFAEKLDSVRPFIDNSLVVLVINAKTSIGQPRSFLGCGFVIRCNGELFWVTASHVFTELMQLNLQVTLTYLKFHVHGEARSIAWNPSQVMTFDVPSIEKTSLDLFQEIHPGPQIETLFFVHLSGFMQISSMLKDLNRLI